MTRKRAKPVDQTSFGMPGTTETPRALRSPPMATGEPRRLLSSTPFQSSSGECRLRRCLLGYKAEKGNTRIQILKRWIVCRSPSCFGLSHPECDSKSLISDKFH
jgi:hypothetical protein